MSLTSVLRRIGRTDITVHGFRSTFRGWCSEYGGNSFLQEICEHALADGGTGLFWRPQRQVPGL